MLTLVYMYNRLPKKTVAMFGEELALMFFFPLSTSIETLYGILDWANRTEHIQNVDYTSVYTMERGGERISRNSARFCQTV